MRAFVAGATGFVGRRIVEQWAEQGGEVVAHVRPDSGRLEQWRGQFEEMGASVDTSAWEPEAFARAIAEHAPDVVFCAIGTTKKRMNADASKDEDSSYRAIDYGLTKLLADATAASAPGARFVYVSSMGVSPSAPGAYMKARYDAEQAILATGLEYAIARPGVISGDRDESRPMESLGALASDALSAAARLVGAKKAARRWAATDDVELARALVRLARERGDSVVAEAEDLKG